MLEDYLDARAGVHGVSSGFILHGVQALIYPNAPYWLVTTAGVSACTIILLVYVWRARVWWGKKRVAQQIN